MSALVRRLASTLGALAVLAVLALGPAVPPAGAIVVEAEEVNVGLQARSERLFDGAAELEEPFKHPTPQLFENPTGAPILPASKIYAIYWDPTDHYKGEWQQAVDSFLAHMGAASGSLASVFAVDAQYTDETNQHASYQSTFMGAYTDTEAYPKATCVDPNPFTGESYPAREDDQITCLTNQQISEQLQQFITDHLLPTGMGTIFYVLTPPGVTVCLKAGGPSGHCSDYSGSATLEKESESYKNSFCSYHSDINPDHAPSGDASTVLYGVIPWTAGGLGDGDLAARDRQQAFLCQDGGYNPASKPIEEFEAAKEKTAKQIQEDKEKTLEEQAKIALAEELEGPHQEEPNQLAVTGADGFRDYGLSDLIVGQIANEQQNIVTDPLLNAWQDPEGNEATDECRDFFAPTLGGSVTASEETGAGSLYNQSFVGGNYYLNDAFNLAALKLPYPAVPCITGAALLPQFTAPDPVNAGEIVGFDGMESDITLNWGTEYSATEAPKPTYAVYTWNFGDGSPEVIGYAPGAPPGNPPETICEEPWRAPCAASAFHAYQYGGTYPVTLTVTDTGGNTARITHEVTVVGPAPPSGPGGGSSSGTPQSTTTSTTTTTTTSQGATPTTGGGSVVLPGPVAKAAAVPGSPKQVARRGLVVHYTVNEQVAGRFEVLLASATAHELGIGGRLATGLPTGSPKELVIGQALLVTTKGGHSSVRIKFDKRTAKHLRRAHKVTLTLRMIVRNASKNPAFTTVTSTVVLHG
jgi:hypothetical protein